MEERRNKYQATTANVVLSILLLFTVSAILGGCAKEEKKVLLIFSGTTMNKPMSEIARIIEKQENCTIVITKGGSGNLLRSIKTNNVGDLFLPGSNSYIETCKEDGLVTETAFVGYNKAAIMVQKGNPKNISNDLNNLLNEDYYVVIGNPDSGSIGKETKKILEKKGILDGVLENSRKLTTDSKDLISVIVKNEADLVINWYAVSKWEENQPFMETLDIDEKFATKKKLVIGLLKTSKYPDTARAFMKYAASEKGRVIFNKYGLYHIN